MSETLKKQAQKFTQTERTGWVLKMTAWEITQVLPPRQPEQLSLFTETNRPITSRHLDSIERFLTDTPNWAMPSIILAVAPGAVSETRNTIEVSTDQLQVLDGQHRIQAFSNVIHGWEMDAPRDESNSIQEKLDRISKEELPVVIMEVQDKRDQRQIFAWFARNKPIEPAVREFFDESDPFNKAAKAAMETSTVLEDRVTYKVKTVPPRNRELMSLNNLKEIATTIQLGIRRAPRAEDRAACWQQDIQTALQQRLVQFFDEFLPTCQPNYEIITQLADFNRKVLNERSVSYALNPLVIRLIANAWARWTEGHEPLPAEKLARHVGQLKLRRADPLNDLETTFGVVAGNRKKFNGIRDKSWEEATTHIIRAARE